MRDASSKIDLFVFNTGIVDAIKFTYKEPFEPLYEKGSHSGAIIGMGICPTKNILGTLSDDKTLKIWNYTNDQKQI